MSPRAAWRLERMGFAPVYDYVGGKVDWMAAGLPTIRRETSQRRALEAVVDVLSCSPDTPVGGLPRAESVVVLNDEGIILGRIGEDRPDDPTQTAEHSMVPGPTTVRAHEPLDPLLRRMEQRNVTEVLVTTPEGRLLGAVRRG